MVARADAEREVRQVEAAYDDAWSRGDLDDIGRLLTDDCVMVNPRGQAIEGRAAFLREVAPFLRGGGHASRIDRVSFASDNVAVVDGRATVRGVDDVVIEHAFTDILVRRDGAWQVAHVRADRRSQP